MGWCGKGRMFQAEKSMCKGPVAGVCEKQEHSLSYRIHGEGTQCERLTRPC